MTSIRTMDAGESVDPGHAASRRRPLASWSIWWLAIPLLFVARLLMEQRRIEVLVSGRQVKDDGSGNGDGADRLSAAR